VRKKAVINWWTDSLANLSPPSGAVEHQPATDPAKRREGVILLVTVILA